MLGELTIAGAVRKPEGLEWSAVWPDMVLRVNYDLRMAIGRVYGFTCQPDGSVEVSAEIAWSDWALRILRVCPSLDFSYVKRDGKAEIAEVSVIDHPANAPAEEKNPWSVASGRLPRVVVQWAALDRWPGAQNIEQFEVGWHAYGHLIEVGPEYAIDDRAALMGLRH